MEAGKGGVRKAGRGQVAGVTEEDVVFDEGGWSLEWGVTKQCETIFSGRCRSILGSQPNSQRGKRPSISWACAPKNFSAADLPAGAAMEQFGFSVHQANLVLALLIAPHGISCSEPSHSLLQWGTQCPPLPIHKATFHPSLACCSPRRLLCKGCTSVRVPFSTHGQWEAAIEKRGQEKDEVRN